MASWNNLEWHHLVRSELGETLVFFRVQMLDFRKHDVLTAITQLLHQERLESARAYLVFGPNDLLLRVWMPIGILSGFGVKLTAALRADQIPQHLTVSKFSRKEYSGGKDHGPNPDSVKRYRDGAAIRAVQSNPDANHVEELIKEKIVLRRSPVEPSTILFWVGVKMRDSKERLKAAVVQKIDTYLSDSETIKRSAIYEGDGFCTLLVKGEVECGYFYSISHLVGWMNDHLFEYDLATETFLSALPSPLYTGHEKVDDRTFIERRSKNPIVESIIPEIYLDLSDAADELIDFIARNCRNIDLTEGDKRLLHDYFAALLDKNQTKAYLTVLALLIEFEAYLDSARGKFTAALGLNAKDVCSAAHITVTQKWSLGNLLPYYYHALKMKELPTASDLKGNWSELFQLRNEAAHGGGGIEEWEDYSSQLVRHLPVIRRLVDIIKKHAVIEPKFLY